MTRLQAYLRLMRWNWNKKKLVGWTNLEQEDEITDFDGMPYLGWMEDEWNSRLL